METNLEKEFLINIEEIQSITEISILSYSELHLELDHFLNSEYRSNDIFRNIKYLLIDQKSDIVKQFAKFNEIIKELHAEYLNIKIILQPHLDSIYVLKDKIRNTNQLISKIDKKLNELSPQRMEKGKSLVEISLSDEYISKIFNEILQINNSIISNTNLDINSANLILEDFKKLNKNQNEISTLNYQKRFKEESALIIKKFDSDISNLTEKYENQFKNLKLDNEKIVNSNNLLSQNINKSLNDLGKLNTKVQSIEIEYSKLIGAETEKIKNELEDAKTKISDQIDLIITQVNEKSKAIEMAHSDFVVLVERAGIYELTNNYKEKSEEEKTEYKTYRKYTSWSILAAIASTILVFIFAFIEHYFAKEGETTNYLLLASRLSISLMFFVLALYLSKQASKHYECYQENHRTFLQLAALEPFMARMTPEEQKEIRKGLIPSYFNQANDGKYSSKGDEVDFSTNATSIINNLIDKFGTKKESESSNKPEGTAG